MTTQLRKALEDAKSFAKQNLQALARDIIEWQEKAVLPDGPMRELANLCSPLDRHGYMRIAESLVNRAALDFVASQPPAGEVPPSEFPKTHYVLGVFGDGYSQDRLIDEPAFDEEMIRSLVRARDSMWQAQVDALKAKVAECEEDTKRLDHITEHRIAIVPEFEGGWDANHYDEDAQPVAFYAGNTPRAAIDAARTPEQKEG